jgi:hypothetical protein
MVTSRPNLPLDPTIAPSIVLVRANGEITTHEVVTSPSHWVQGLMETEVDYAREHPTTPKVISIIHIDFDNGTTRFEDPAPYYRS